MRQELMERRIKQPHRHGKPLHRGENACEVFPLVRKQLLQGLLSVDRRPREDHLPHRLDAITLEEHMLGPAKPDSDRPELPSSLGILRGVGIGPNSHSGHAIRPLEHGREITRDLAWDHPFDLTDHDLAS